MDLSYCEDTSTCLQMLFVHDQAAIMAKYTQLTKKDNLYCLQIEREGQEHDMLKTIHEKSIEE